MLRVLSVSGVCRVMKSALQELVEFDLLHAEIGGAFRRQRERIEGDHRIFRPMPVARRRSRRCCRNR